MKLNLQEVANVDEKFSTIEGAIEGSTRLQMLGGAGALYGSNTMQMLYESLSDPEALYERMTKMFADQATFDRKTGEARISPFQQAIIREQARAMGMNETEAVSNAKQQAKLGAIESDFRKFVPGVYAAASPEQKEAILNKAEYDAEKKMLEDSKASFETLPREVRLQYETVEAGAKDGILFVGPTGTGKTWISMALAVKAGAHREDIQITATTQPEDLIGSPAVDTRPDAQGKFRFIEGPLLKAYYLGYVISIQEVNYATFGANSCLNRFLDGTLQIEVNGTVYHRHPNFVAYLTMNAGYEDTNKLNKALKNRFTIVQIPPLTEMEYCRRLTNFSEYLGHRISDNFAKEIFKFSNVMQKIVNSAGWHESVDYSLRNATALLKTILLKNRNFEDFSLAVHSEYLNLLSCDNDNSLKLQEFKKSEEVVNYIKKLYEFYDFSEAEEAGDLDFSFDDLFKVEEKPEEAKEEEKVMDDLYKRFDL
jgi:hypothetical protein